MPATLEKQLYTRVGARATFEFAAVVSDLGKIERRSMSQVVIESIIEHVENAARAAKLKLDTAEFYEKYIDQERGNKQERLKGMEILSEINVPNEQRNLEMYSELLERFRTAE